MIKTKYAVSLILCALFAQQAAARNPWTPSTPCRPQDPLDRIQRAIREVQCEIDAVCNSMMCCDNTRSCEVGPCEPGCGAPCCEKCSCGKPKPKSEPCNRPCPQPCPQQGESCPTVCPNVCPSPCPSTCPNTCPKTPCKRNMPEPQVCEDDETVYIKLPMPCPVDPDRIEVNRVKEDEKPYLRIQIPADTCCVEVVIQDQMVMMTTKQETQEECVDKDCKSMRYAYGSWRSMQQLPCKVCFDNVRAEYNPDTRVVTISLCKVQPEMDRVPVVVMEK